MAILNLKLTGVVAGAGAALLGTILLPTLGSALKGATKIIIKNSLLAYQGSRGVVDRATKAIEHIAAEAKSELN
jgi:hypothetical protein